jgi:tetratricopeptide (TPR) repeat protein
MRNTILIFSAITLLTNIFVACSDTSNDVSDAPDSFAGSQIDTSGLESGNRIKELNDKIIANPNNPDNYFQRAYAHFYLAMVPEALDDIQKALSIDDSNAEYYFARGMFFHSTLKLEEAKTAFEQALERNPKHPQANLYLAKIFLALYRYEEVYVHVNEALKINPNLAEAYFIKGVAYEENKDTSNAVSSYLTATEQDANYYEAYIRLGVIYARRKDPLAEQFYKNALNVRPTSTEALYNLGMFYQNTAKYDFAVKTYQAIIDLNPEYALSYYNLGYMYLEYDTAYYKSIEYFEKALSHNPENFLPHTYFNLGLANERLKKRDKAIEYYRKALESQPDFTQAAEALQRLQGRI